MKINIDPGKRLYRWGPIDGRLIYPDFFNLAFVEFVKKFDFSWPDVIGLFHDGKMEYIIDEFQLRRKGEIIFTKVLLDNTRLKKSFTFWKKQIADGQKFQKNISARSLKSYNNSELLSVYQRWSELYLEFWAQGHLPELANWGGEQMFERTLRNKVPADDFITAFEKLSAPENLSFYQTEELELLNFKKARTNSYDLDQKIDQHQRNYFWILNSYATTRVLNKKYFFNKLNSLNTSQAFKKRKELLDLRQEVRRQKAQLIKKYGLGQDVAKMAKRLAFCVWWQDLRKYYILLANHVITIFLKEAGRRFDVQFDYLLDYSQLDFLNLLSSGGKVAPNIIRSRRKGMIVYYDMNKNKLFYNDGELAKRAIDEFSKNQIVIKNVKDLAGLVVSQGNKVVGPVRIIASTKDMSMMRKGEVLVASMTAPDYVVAMRKASAIITDEGGMTSHAAIVSRELGVPCIVGTRIATKVLKNGFVVEVNTKEGKIKILKHRDE